MKYKLKKKDNPLNPMASGQWYATPVYAETVSTEEVARKISERSTISPADMEGVLESLATIIPECLAKGEAVYLRGVGTFRVNISSGGVENPNDFKSSLIKLSKIIYTPDVKIQNKLSELIHYEDSNIRGSAAINIAQVMDYKSGLADKYISCGEPVRISGQRISIKGEDNSVGLKLINVESNQEFVLPMSSIPVNKAKEIVFMVPRDLPAGQYQIRIVTQSMASSTRTSKTVHVCTYEPVLEAVALSE